MEEAMRMLLGLAILGSTVVMGAQSPPPATDTPAFEVASVRRNPSAEQRASVRGEPGGRLTITNNTLFNIVRNAYNVQGFQIVGGPEWVNTDRWDIIAKAEGETSQQRMMLMLQNLIAERFKATVRRDTREMPVYALVVGRPDGRLGPLMNPAALDCAALAAAAGRTGAPPPPPQPSGRPSCGIRTGAGMLMAGGTLMTDFARNLSGATGRIIVDKTGLTGRYDIDLTWTPDQLQAAAADALESASLFAAIQEQLGLRLQAERAPVDVLVIDSAQRPAED
jgi:uncharacterized protein (TIGR03435 family)